MADQLFAGIRKAAGWSIAFSVLLMATGVFAVLAPAAAGYATTVVFGWLLMISGVFHLGYAWRAPRPAAVVLEILIVLVYGAIGFYLLRKPVVGLEALTVALVVYLMFEGALEFGLAFYLRPMAGSGWPLFDGILTVLWRC